MKALREWALSRVWPLRTLVHFEAFLRSPVLYLQGVGWRLRRLKLRARHRFSALMGHASHAYELWMASREPEVNRPINLNDKGLNSFIVLVDCRNAEQSLIYNTLDSIANTGCRSVETALLDCSVQVPQGCHFVTSRGEFAQLLEAKASMVRPRWWIIGLKAGDRLAPAAFDAYLAAINASPESVMFYSDDDLTGDNGRRQSPHFKPRWNAELFDFHDFVTGSCAFAADSITLSETCEEEPLMAASLRVAEPVHIPRVLHHRISRPEPKVGYVLNKTTAPDGLPNVSVVVPTRDHAKLLRMCLDGLAATKYPSMDITVIDNGSTDRETLTYLSKIQADGIRVWREPGPFNYAGMHNAVVPHLNGPLVCFLNNDIEVIDPDWLAQMVPNALRDDIGAVGARLLYPDRTIQHAGIVLGMGGGAGHAHRLQPDNAIGYFGRAHLPQRVSAVTAACLVVRKDRFESVGGFDAENFAVAFNDVDLCLKLNAAGWQSFYEPRACLVHHESKSRGRDRRGHGRRRLAGELAALKRRWLTDQIQDPYHHPELSKFTEQFVVRL